MSEYQEHPASSLFPMMDEAGLRELAADIRQNGLLEPIILYDNKILDGRNRLAACKRVAVDAKFKTVNGEIGSPVMYVVSKNLHRRHLTTSQKAAIGADMLPLLEQEAQKRQEASWAKPGEKIGSNVVVERPSPCGTSRETAGRLLGVGGATVGRAAAVKRDDPETFEKVKRGEITVNAAYDGHKKQPKIGGQQTCDVSTKRGKERAEAHKRRMVDGLSTLGGICHGLPSLEAGMIAAISQPEELETWALKAEKHARELKRFAAELRKYGKSASCTDGKDAGGQLGDSSGSTEEVTTGVAQEAS